MSKQQFINALAIKDLAKTNNLINIVALIDKLINKELPQ